MDDAEAKSYAKKKFKELQTVKRNIDQILRREEPHRRKEQIHER